MNGLVGAWSKLVSGNAANGVLQLAIFAVAAQALDLAALGLLIIVQTYVRFVDGVLNFQSVNVLTNFMATAQERGDTAGLKGLVKAGLLIDFGTAFLATIVAIAALPLVAGWLGLGGDWVWLAAAYALVIATRAFGAIEAALRCFDRFGAISLRLVSASLVVLAGSLMAWGMGWGAQGFLLIWLVGEGLANLVYLGWSMIVLRRQGMADLGQSDAGGAIAASQGFWPMMWQTNATFGIRMLSQEADVLLAGAVLGPAAAGLLRAAKNLANLVGQFGRPLQQVASAPIARFVAARNAAGALSYTSRIGLIAGLGGLAAVLGGLILAEFALSLLFGAEFGEAQGVLVALLVTAMLFMFGVATMPLALAFNRPDLVLRATLWGTVAYAFAMAAFIPPYGLLGIGMAHIAFNTTWLIFNMVTLRSAARQLEAAPQ